MARFKIIAGGQSRLYDILDDALTAGSAASNAIRIEQDGIAAVHAMVWRAADGVWVSPVESAPLRVNGEAISRHRLRHGDRVELGERCALEFVDPTSARPAPRPAAEKPAAASPARDEGGNVRRDAKPAAPPARPDRAGTELARRKDKDATPARLVVPSSAREARDRRAHREERADRRGRRAAAAGAPRWHLFSGILLLSAAVVWIAGSALLDRFGRGSAEDLLVLAETQLERGHTDLAAQTVQSAAARAQGDAELARKIATLEAKIKEAGKLAADGPMLDQARQGFENLKVFEQSYLVATPTSRPACREFVRVLDAWRERYAAVCERYPESKAMVTEAAALRARYATAAQLELPDDVEDVMFVAKRATRLKRPRYRSAIAALDAFVARGGDPAAIERVKKYRAELVENGRFWFDTLMGQLKQQWERGRSDAVLGELEWMAESVLDEWRPEFDAQVKTWKQAAGR